MDKKEKLLEDEAEGGEVSSIREDSLFTRAEEGRRLIKFELLALQAHTSNT